MDKPVFVELTHPCKNCITFPVCKQKAYSGTGITKGILDMGPVFKDCSIIRDVADLLDESCSEIEPLISVFRK